MFMWQIDNWLTVIAVIGLFVYFLISITRWLVQRLIECVGDGVSFLKKWFLRKFTINMDLNMKVITNLKFKLRNILGFIPMFSNHVFMDAEQIIKKLRDDGMVDYIRGLRPSERRLLYVNFGQDIRNAFHLWHPQNPHTSLLLAGLNPERQADSPFHPDNFSWAILRHLIVESGHSPYVSAVDSAESLLYSLLARVDDSQETLDAIRGAVTDLIATESFDLLDLVFAECLDYYPSLAKLNVLLNSVVGYREHITPANYTKVLKRAVSYGFAST